MRLLTGWGILPYGVRIKWVDVEKPETYLKDGVVILKMKNYRNNSKNLAYAASFYVTSALIPEAKPYIHPKIMEGMEYVVTKEFVEEDPLSIEYLKEVFKAALEDKETRNKILKLEAINDQRFLTRILLREYTKLSNLYPREPDENTYSKQ